MFLTSSRALVESGGFVMKVSSPYTPEDNTKAERIWGTMGLGMTKCMMETACMGKSYWSYAMKAAFHVTNFVIQSSHGKTPHELFLCEETRCFGCSAVLAAPSTSS